MRLAARSARLAVLTVFAVFFVTPMLWLLLAPTKSDAGLVSYVYPLNTEKFSAKPIKNVTVKVELESERPLKSIYSPSHSVEIKRHGSNRAVETRNCASAGFNRTKSSVPLRMCSTTVLSEGVTAPSRTTTNHCT